MITFSICSFFFCNSSKLLTSNAFLIISSCSISFLNFISSSTLRA
nr:MAG TPA: hypothetical protein [Caudoviricetes sp.]